MKEIPVFIVDSSVLKSMFEGKDKNSSNVLLNKIAQMKKEKLPCSVITTLASFQRALWKADSNSKLEYVQSAMDILDIIKTEESDYKNEEKVRNDVLKLAEGLSKLNKEESK